MLMRKWVIDNKGHLAGIWNDWNQPRSLPVYLTEKPQPRAAHSSRGGIGRISAPATDPMVPTRSLGARALRRPCR